MTDDDDDHDDDDDEMRGDGDRGLSSRPDERRRRVFFLDRGDVAVEMSPWRCRRGDVAVEMSPWRGCRCDIAVEKSRGCRRGEVTSMSPWRSHEDVTVRS